MIQFEEATLMNENKFIQRYGKFKHGYGYFFLIPSFKLFKLFLCNNIGCHQFVAVFKENDKNPTALFLP